MEIAVISREIPGVGRAVYTLFETELGFGISVSLPERDEALEIPDICTGASDARELFDLIYAGSVTPATLSDVVYDWLCR